MRQTGIIPARPTKPMEAEAFIAQWELANDMLDEIERRDKDIAFDLTRLYMSP